MNEERMKNSEEQSRKCYGSVTEAPQPLFFFLFLLLLTNFTQNLSISSAKPLTYFPSRLFIGNEGWRLHTSSPRQAQLA